MNALVTNHSWDVMLFSEARNVSAEASAEAIPALTDAASPPARVRRIAAASQSANASGVNAPYSRAAATIAVKFSGLTAEVIVLPDDST
jgi:hypothetical protein